MDIHKNARLTLRRREDLVEYVATGVKWDSTVPSLLHAMENRARVVGI